MTGLQNYSFPHSFTILNHPKLYSISNRFLTVQSAARVLAINNPFNPTNNPSQITPHNPKNFPLWTVSAISEAVNGRIVKWGSPGTISTDTRTLIPGQWFFAITGDNFDAHNFISLELYEKGCIGVIGNRVCENWDRGFVQIDGDTVISLEKMGNYARNRFDGCLIGVTGSVGKTTTRTMIALALESVGQIYQTYGNQNNRIGVALSLIGLPLNSKIAVLEMGMSEKGEILELARMARPTIRVILNVGASHLENFKSLEEVSMAKGEILVEAKPGDVCVLNGDDPLVMSLPVPIGVRKVLYGRSLGCDVRLVGAESTDGGLGVRVVLENYKERYLYVAMDAELCMKATDPQLYKAAMDPQLCEAATSGSNNLFSDRGPSSFLKETLEKNSALHLDVKFNKKQLAEKFINLHPPLLDLANSKGDTLLHIAARGGSLEMTELIISHLKTRNLFQKKKEDDSKLRCRSTKGATEDSKSRKRHHIA